MRKFIPRVFNIISFLLALLILIPWYSIKDLCLLIYSKFDNLTFLKEFTVYLEDYVGLKVLFIPSILIGLSFIFLLISGIDHKIKSHNKKTSYPLMNMTLQPVYYLGIAISISAGITAFLNKISFKINENDYFGLGKSLLNIEFLNKEYNPFIYLIIAFALVIIFLLFAVIFKNNFKRKFILKLFAWLIMLALLFVSTKFVSDIYTGLNGKTISDLYLIESVKGIKEVEIVEDGHYSLLILGLISLVLYIIIAPIEARKLNKKFESITVKKKTKKNKNKKNNNENTSLEEYKEENEDDEDYHLQDNDLNVINPLFAIPEPENKIETKIEEKTIIKQVVYEQNDLDKIFNYEFGFKYCSMVKGNNEVDYYVNKNKFLTLSNNNHSISFRLELDKAIRLIIQYPLIGKDKYENHKIWFKIDDISILSGDIIIGIINDAYQTVLNNK